MAFSSSDSEISGLATSRLVAEIRARTHETQEALARRMGVSFPTLNAWERGHREPRQLYRIRLEQMALDLGIQRGPKFLVIDDDRASCEVLGSNLERICKDAEIELVENGAEGLMVCGSFKPDVVFLDILMPRVDGLEVAERMENIEALKATEIVFVTAATDPDILDRARSSTAVDVLAKPVSIESVRKALDDAGVLYVYNG